MDDPVDHDQSPIPFLGIAGAALLAGGVFAPVAHFPDGAAPSFRDFDAVNGNILLGLAGATFVLTWVFQWYRAVWVTGGAAMFVLFFSFTTLLRKEVAGVSWGWLVLAAGTGLILLAALRAEIAWRRDRDRKQRTNEEEEPADPDVDEPME